MTIHPLLKPLFLSRLFNTFIASFPSVQVKQMTQPAMPRPASKLRTVFLDLDDTLIDTSARHYAVFSSILHAYGISNTLNKEEFWEDKRQGKRNSDLISESLPPRLLRQFKNDWIRTIEARACLTYDTRIPGCAEVLSALYQEVDLVLVTLRNSKENLEWELRRLELAGFFKEVLVGSPLHLRTKTPLILPSIDPSVDKEEYMIVGDTEIDILTGRQLGIVTVAATYGIRSRAILRALNPDICLKNICDILDIIPCSGTPRGR